MTFRVYAFFSFISLIPFKLRYLIKTWIILLLFSYTAIAYNHQYFRIWVWFNNVILTLMSNILELYSQSYTSLPKYLTILCFHFQVPDEKSRFDDLHVYNAQDIIVTLPTPMSVYDINFLSVYKEEVNSNNIISLFFKDL